MATDRVIVRVHWIMKAAALIFVGFAGISLVSAFTETQRVAFIGAAFFGGIAILSWVLSNSYIQMDSEAVLVSVPYGTFRISWNEVRLIETNGTYIAFYGDDKRVVIAMGFAGSGAREMIDFLNSQISQRQIESRYSAYIPMTHKNARV